MASDQRLLSAEYLNHTFPMRVATKPFNVPHTDEYEDEDDYEDGYNHKVSKLIEHMFKKNYTAAVSRPTLTFQSVEPYGVFLFKETCHYGYYKTWDISRYYCFAFVSAKNSLFSPYLDFIFATDLNRVVRSACILDEKIRPQALIKNNLAKLAI